MLRSLEIALYLYFAITISIYDCKSHLIRNRELVKFLALSAALNIFSGHFQGFAIAAALLPIALLVVSIFGNKIGSGDLKLYLVLAIWCCDIQSWFTYFAYSWILGGIYGVLLIFRGKGRLQRIAFAPFIFLGFLSAI